MANVTEEIMRPVALLVVVLLATGTVCAAEIDIVASQDTLVLKIDVQPTSGNFNHAGYADLEFEAQRTSQKVIAADRLVDEMVETSFSGGDIDSRKNAQAVQLRREWAEKIDRTLQTFRGTAKVTLSVEFPESEVKILLGRYKDWPTVKKELAGKNDEIKSLLAYRRRLTDALLAVAWLRMRQDPAPSGYRHLGAVDDSMDFRETEPVGSVTRTSDLDVTTVGYNCAAAVGYFNDYFRRGFCAESGIVLDSNVYCEIYKEHRSVPNGIKNIRDAPDGNPACQDAMALAKLRRYAKPKEWADFAEANKTSPSVAQAKQFFDYFNQEIKRKPAAGRMPNCTASRSAEAAEMAASNQLYAQRLEILRKALWERGGNVDKVKFEQSAANLFANESYNSQGPLLHVLGIIQGKRRELVDRITKEQLLNSVNEQIGDALKDLTHYEHSATIGEALYKSSKYVDRALQAVWMMEAKDPHIDMHPSGDKRFPTVLETEFSRQRGYDLETLLRLRGGAEGTELVFTKQGMRERQVYDYRELKDAEKAKRASESSPGIKSYVEFRRKLISAATDINARARKGMKSAQCGYSLR